ncbi:citryl-CoA lyase [Nitrogeniibacter mangrovi]|uniref:Citryl-CoA lyase n=1 Tax=Nitrogeniibacter mangrovi TaxID=2016596 RepID=A0A6C1B0F4_9RHOO|nr:citrate/2-methylcitrate synthase [Nitrogeniibacter mangrovi]QID16479.1 citryl-CoA lyase [Nitrogeniibacter mangrovi]
MSEPVIHTRIWDETPDPRSPFLGRSVRLYGYDYYGELLGQARWIDMLWLLLTGDAPTADQAALLERLAVALANPGPRDPSVHAAMCGGIGGSRPAASLMAALAVASGDHGGAGELRRAMQAWQHGADTASTLAGALADLADEGGIWPGFSPLTRDTARPVLQCLEILCASPLANCLVTLREAHTGLSATAGLGLSLLGVAAATCVDLDLSPEQGEALFLLLRLPGTLAHALEQSGKSHKQFPFFTLSERYEPEAAR